MKYLNNKLYKELENKKYIIHDGKILLETKLPKSLRTRYEVMFNRKLTKTESVVELDDGTLQLVGSQESKSKNLTTHQQPKPSEN